MSKADLLKRPRKYYSDNLKVNRWNTVKKELQKILEMPFKGCTDLELFIEKSGEASQILFSYRNQLFIQMICKTTLFNSLKYLWFQNRIIRKGLHYNNLWEKKVESSPYSLQLNDKRYGHLLKLISHQRSMYVKENSKLIAKEEKLSGRYGYIVSRITIKIDGVKTSVPQIERKLVDKDRDVRKKAFFDISKTYQNYKSSFEKLFSELIQIRQNIASNANFKNYRDYAHAAKGRFSYSIEDVLRFHDVVSSHVGPLLRELNLKLAKSHHLNVLQPWDIKIDETSVMSPYANGEDLFQKCALTLNEIKSEYGNFFRKLDHSKLLDVFHRRKKTPGSYNIPLFEQGASFIFSNFVEKKGTFQDITILHHEFGHALHNHFTTEEKIMSYRNFPAEIAELAAMTMEMLAMGNLQHYYSDPSHRKLAQMQQWRRFLTIILSRTAGDAFQHWIYTNPKHFEEERYQAFKITMNRFNDGISWAGVEEYQHLESLKALHFFQVPFYYIEYAFAALGAIDIYRKYKENPENAIKSYETFLSSGYNKDVHNLYQQAGTEFDFSESKVMKLMEFVRNEIGL